MVVVKKTRRYELTGKISVVLVLGMWWEHAVEFIEKMAQFGFMSRASAPARIEMAVLNISSVGQVVCLWRSSSRLGVALDEHVMPVFRCANKLQGETGDNIVRRTCISRSVVQYYPKYKHIPRRRAETASSQEWILQTPAAERQVTITPNTRFRPS